MDIKTVLFSSIIGLGSMIMPLSAPIDNIDKYKVLEIDFDKNEIKNNVNNEIYSLENKLGSGKFSPTIKGNGFQFNKDAILIPTDNLNINENTETVTVSFLYKFDGTDDIAYPLSFGSYNLLISSTQIGFNTNVSDIYGSNHNLIKGNTYNIIAEFNKGDVTKNKIFINGEEQTLSQINTNSHNSNNAFFGKTISIGKIANSTYDLYYIEDTSIIDEIKVFTTKLSTSEVSIVSSSHRIPELRVQNENGKARLNWALEMLDEDVLWSVGYEDESIINFNYKDSPNGIDGGQKIVTDIVYEGEKARMSPKTIGGLGNKYEDPATSGNQNMATFNQVPLDNSAKGQRLAITSRVRSQTNKVGLWHYSSWDFGKSFIQYSNKVVETAEKGSYYLKLDSVDNMVYNRWLSFDTDEETIKYNFLVKEIDKVNKTIKLNKPLPYDIVEGYTLKARPPRYGFKFPEVSLTLTPNDWTLVSNTTILGDYADYDYMERPQALRELITAYDTTYTDDIKMGFAPSVVVYRDNKEIYKGSESTFLDSGATDTTAPNEINSSTINVNMEMINTDKSERKITINFDETTDKESIFTYNIKSVGKNGESPLSKTISLDMASGIKGYSYVIDKSSSTVPDDTVDTADTSIKSTITDSGVYYVHIKAIDNAGNVSSVVHHKIDIPILISIAKPNNNMVRLDWTLNDTSSKKFKVYQKKEGSNEFQSIGATNFENGKQVKVLNIYPNDGNTISYTTTTWDGETVTLPISASLKKWMEEPNAENPKGYGKGIIEVTPVQLSDFNANPSNYLNKELNGNWNYDVIMIGTWDANALQDISDISLPIIKQFIEDGKGILFGHDTIGYLSEIPNIRALSTYVNLIPTGGLEYNGNETEFGTEMTGETSSVKIIKRGLLTNYPWNIGDIGTLLTVPKTHSLGQIANGDIWMKFNGANYNDSDNSNFYLTSWNNTAMIQTGHSKGSATPDEQKVLANTLFYLNQLSSDTFLDDYSGQDIKAPTKPTLNNYTFNDNGEIEILFNEVTDNGSKYEYYIESENKNGNEVTLSEVKEVEILSGLKGYSYVIDSNSNTIPDDTIEMSSIKTIKTKIDNSKEIYVHIKAIDNVGNVSETLHYKLEDTNAPTLSVTNNPTDWTNKDVTLNISANDLESGLSYILLPNGNKVTTSTTSYTVSSNGTYTFKAYDNVGNETIVNVVVNKIDKELPTINYTKEFNANKTSVYINLSVIDSLSGFSKLELPTGEIITTSSYKYPISNNGMYLFTAWDKANNESVIVVTVNELNTNDTASGISKIEYKLSGATIKDWTTYTEAFYITNEGITTITARSYDKAGNISSEATSQVKIDKTKPINNGIEIKLK